MPKAEKINISSFLAFQTVMGAVMGLILGIIYAGGGLVIDTLVTLGVIVTAETPGISYGTLLAFGALIGMPLLFGMCGLLIGVIEALMYNLLMRKVLPLNLNFKK